jgi:hypothetical protein
MTPAGVKEITWQKAMAPGWRQTKIDNIEIQKGLEKALLKSKPAFKNFHAFRPFSKNILG